MGAVDTWLTAEEVERLTDRVQPAALSAQPAEFCSVCGSICEHLHY